MDAGLTPTSRRWRTVANWNGTRPEGGGDSLEADSPGESPEGEETADDIRNWFSRTVKFEARTAFTELAVLVTRFSCLKDMENEETYWNINILQS